MDAEFWLKRWREGRIGWHHEAVMPLLEKHWPTLGIPRGTSVLVPLAGKTLDMLWLSQQGMQVVGVELSPIAVESFLAENHLHALPSAGRAGTRYRVTNPPGGSIDLINGDVFAVDPAVLAGCAAFYDRAAMIALPPPMRERMVREVYARLAPDSHGLLITLDYPQQEMDGPPFSVSEAEMHKWFDAGWNVDQLERRDILEASPNFSEQGVTSMHTAVYRLARRHEQTQPMAA